MFVRSLVNGDHVRLGMDTGRLLVGTMDLGRSGYTQPQVEDLFARMEAQVRRLGGVAGASVVDDGLKAVANFGPIFMLDRRDEEKYAAIGFFVADAKLLEEFVAIFLDGFAFKRANGDDGHLRAGFLLELGAEIFEAGPFSGMYAQGGIGD